MCFPVGLGMFKDKAVSLCPHRGEPGHEDVLSKYHDFPKCKDVDGKMQIRCRLSELSFAWVMRSMRIFRCWVEYQLDSIQHSKTYFLGKMKKFRESRFQITQSLCVVSLLFITTYYLRKTQNLSFDRRFVLQKAFQDTFAFLSTNYQRIFRKFSDNRFFSCWENLNRINNL